MRQVTGNKLPAPRLLQTDNGAGKSLRKAAGVLISGILWPVVCLRPVFAFTLVLLCLSGIVNPPGATAASSSSVEETEDTTVLEITAVRVGFAGRYKLGCWTPVEITLRGGDTSVLGTIQIDLPDGDGLPARFSTQPIVIGPTTPGQPWHVTLFAKFGRGDRDLIVRVVVDEHGVDERSVASRTFSSTVGQAVVRGDTNAISTALPSTDELLVVLGAPLDLARVVRQTSHDQRRLSHVAHLEDDRQLPTHWSGYDGVDTVLISTSQSEATRRLSSGKDRLRALRRWVELGGRLIWFVGRQTPTVLAVESPWADLAPGTFEQMVTLRRTSALEQFSKSKHPVPTSRGEPPVEVPQLVDHQGSVQVWAAHRPQDIPLIVRAPRGFGEIVFVGLDLDQAPLAQWKGRHELLRRLLSPEAGSQHASTVASASRVYSQGYENLSGQLRASLDRFSSSVRVVPFAVVVGLAVLYILLIGPGDYYFLKRLVGRMEWTWFTFPTIIVVFCTGTYFLATGAKGDQQHLHQVELVDVDLATGLVRGAAWCNVLSPSPKAFDLSFVPAVPASRPSDDRSTGNRPLDDPHVLLSWMGVPGRALGGMRSAADQPLFSQPYAFSPERNRLSGVPIPQWSAKSFVARWMAHAEPGLSAELTQAADHMLRGTLRNDLGVDLTDCWLCYDRWLYSIPRLEHGQPLSVGDMPRPTTFQSSRDRRVYDRTSHNVDTILRTVMFHQALGSQQYTALGNDYLATYDLSGHLAIGRAILVGQVERTGGPSLGSQLLDGGEPIAAADDPHTILYRFVLPVRREKNQQPKTALLTNSTRTAAARGG